MLETLISYFSAYGYYFLFLATTLENIPVVGMLVPGEVIVVAAGFLAGNGDLELAPVLTVSILGAILGTNIGYLLGRHGGRPLIESLSKKLHVDGERVKAAEEYFDTRGAPTVFVGRYIAGIKAFIIALAGAGRMRYRVFLIYSTLGILTWTVLAVTLGYFFGEYWETLIFYWKGLGWLILFAAVVFLGVLWFRRRRGR